MFPVIRPLPVSAFLAIYSPCRLLTLRVGSFRHLVFCWHVFLSKPQNQGVRLRYPLMARQALSAARRLWRVGIRTAVALTSKVSATAVTVTHMRKRVIGFYV